MVLFSIYAFHLLPKQSDHEHIFFCNWSNQIQLLQLLLYFLLGVTDKSLIIFIREATYCKPINFRVRETFVIFTEG